MGTYIHFFKQGILDELTRVKASVNGNPRYNIRLDGLGIEGKTKPDAHYCYDICKHWEGKPVSVEYHFTPRGKLVIDNLQLIKKE